MKQLKRRIGRRAKRAPSPGQCPPVVHPQCTGLVAAATFGLAACDGAAGAVRTKASCSWGCGGSVHSLSPMGQRKQRIHQTKQMVAWWYTWRYDTWRRLRFSSMITCPAHPKVTPQSALKPQSQNPEFVHPKPWICTPRTVNLCTQNPEFEPDHMHQAPQATPTASSAP